MSRTSKALKRLGVAGVAVATIGAGVPAFFATAALAAGPATTITITPSSQTGAAGTCLVYTVSENAADGTQASSPDTVTVQLQDSPSADPTATPSVRFCTVDANNNATVAAPTNDPASNLAGTRTQNFSLTNGKATFGVYDATPETITIRAFNDANNDGQQGPNELGAPTATAVFTAGGVAGTAAAADAVATVTATPKTDAKPAGTTQVINVLLLDANGNPVPGVQPLAQIESGPNAAVPATIGVPGTPAKTVTCGTTNNAGETTCTYTGDAAKTGTDVVRVYVNRSGGTVAYESATEKSDTVQRTNTGVPATARTVDLKPDTVTSASGSFVNFSATVTDMNNTPVAGVRVYFTLTGVGQFRFGGTSTYADTNASGVASVQTETASNQTGTQTVKADISTTPGTSSTTTNQCNSAAGTPTGSTTAGNCTDTSTNTVTVTGSPSATPTATPTSSTPAGRQALTLRIDTPVIKAGQRGDITVTGTVGQAIQLMCYTRPSTTYFVARETTISTGSVQFALSLGMNTRCYARYTTNNTSGASLSGVINVQTVISIFPVRNSYRNYTFQGHNMPKYAGQLITLYFVNSNGTSTIKGQIHTNTTGIYYIPVKFVSSGTHTFYVRTGQTMTNAAGESAHVAVNIH